MIKLKRDADGIVRMRGADLRGADLYKAELQKADLEGANLQGANLRDADLSGANLDQANLEKADLEKADLQWADLHWANLKGANLKGAYLYRVDLQAVNLKGANLKGANLEGADLRDAELKGTNLRGAILWRADLVGAKIEDARGIDDVPKKPLPGLPARVLEQIKKQPKCLDMRHWHSDCGTKHCFAGWAVTLAGEIGKAAEERLGTSRAAALLLGGYLHPFDEYSRSLVIPWLEARVKEGESLGD